MAKQLYGYTTSTYGGGGGATTSLYSSRSGADSYLSADTSLLGTSSRYLSGDSLSSSSVLSSSLLYNPDSYSTRIPGVSINTPTHSYGPPGVDVSSTVTDLYAGLKRTSSEFGRRNGESSCEEGKFTGCVASELVNFYCYALYHQTLLGAHNNIGQTEAWYSTNSLSKRPRYESTSHLPIYPQRPGEKDCAYYMQTRTCKFGESCKFDHPIWVPEGGIPDWKEVPPVPSESLPERQGEPDCPVALEDGDVSVLPERPSEPPCAILAGEENGTVVQNIIFGDAKTAQPPVSPALLHNSKGLPVRPGEEDCPFYLKTGSDQSTCSCYCPNFANLSSSHFNVGVVAPTSSLLSTFDPRLTQTMLGLGSTIYPQRPGQLECDVRITLSPLCYYMKTGVCKFGNNCKFHHPIDRSTPKVSVTESLQQNVTLTLAGLPRREGAIHCPYYMKTGTCKYGATCKFDHPPPGEVMAIATSQPTSTSAVGEGKENGDA
ncbi:hypothetical protein DH2020_042359 [Rehmannia glutinosa]|uniref:C3H1-type domain-containing protein n=1 Tax=Rehmannia glutinosa TaxID=99300 RepID=A0ABR0UP28_REHGL